MTERLSQLCEAEFEHGIEHYADLLFEARDRAARVFATVSREHPNPTRCCMQLIDLICRAERARLWFARHGPSWCQPLPVYYWDEQETILCSSDFSKHLVVFYANSLQQLQFDYLTHPLFYDYARGVMAHPNCPMDLREDEFPPKRLPGLDSGMMWSGVTD